LVTLHKLATVQKSVVSNILTELFNEINQYFYLVRMYWSKVTLKTWCYN